MTKEMKSMPVICFGETLWDIFENQKKPGGAPMNVAVHLRQFGIASSVISKVGNDELGSGLLEFLKTKKVDVSLIQIDNEEPTGLVNVKLGPKGDAQYDIVFPSAWDFIGNPASIKHPFILVFGSLASRSETSRNTLLNLIENADLALFDVNFRAPHYTRTFIEQLLTASDIVKLNEHEIAIIGEWIGLKDASYEKLIKKVAEIFKINHIIVTLGDKGAMVFIDGIIHRHPGFKIKVADTVGSGDSFLASYLSNFIKGKPAEYCLEMACATGAYVATQNGAVPEYKISDIESILKN